MLLPSNCATIYANNRKTLNYSRPFQFKRRYMDLVSDKFHRVRDSHLIY